MFPRITTATVHALLRATIVVLAVQPGIAPLFDWNDDNTDHIRNRHGIEPEEAEQAVLDPRRIGLGAYNTAGEKRRGLAGATEAGRIVTVIFTARSGLIHVVTARDSTDSEKRRYRRRGR